MTSLDFLNGNGAAGRHTPADGLLSVIRRECPHLFAAPAADSATERPL